MTLSVHSRVTPLREWGSCSVSHNDVIVIAHARVMTSTTHLHHFVEKPVCWQHTFLWNRATSAEQVPLLLAGEKTTMHRVCACAPAAACTLNPASCAPACDYPYRRSPWHTLLALVPRALQMPACDDSRVERTQLNPSRRFVRRC